MAQFTLINISCHKDIIPSKVPNVDFAIMKTWASVQRCLGQPSRNTFHRKVGGDYPDIFLIIKVTIMASFSLKITKNGLFCPKLGISC